MPQPYSVDLRESVVGSVEGGLSCRETAKRFHVSVSFVIKLHKRWRQRETVVAGRVRSITFGNIRPGRARAKPPENTVQHAPVIHPRYATRFVRQQWFDD